MLTNPQSGYQSLHLQHSTEPSNRSRHVTPNNASRSSSSMAHLIGRCRKGKPARCHPKRIGDPDPMMTRDLGPLLV